MAKTDNKARGLTRLIYEALVSQTPELVEAGESWTPELLDQVEHNLKQKFSPRPTQREQLIFNMVFQRSFAEAKHLLLDGLALEGQEKGYPTYAYPQAAQLPA